jgi:hypothetical protein
VNNLYPATPIEGTGVGSLVSVEDYVQITGDTVNGSQPIIDEATIEVCQYCNRTLAYGQYTERLYVDRKGMSYPSFTPLDPNQPTSPESSMVQGPAVYVGYFTPLPDLPVWTGVVLPQSDITAWGGYQVYGNTSGPTPQLPPKLMRAICAIAYSIANPVILSGVPAGATSVSLQGVSVAGSFSTISSWQNDPNLRRTLSAYRRREIPAFGN